MALLMLSIFACTRALMHPLPSSQSPRTYKNEDMIYTTPAVSFFIRCYCYPQIAISMCMPPNMITKRLSPNWLGQVLWICLARANSG